MVKNLVLTDFKLVTTNFKGGYNRLSFSMSLKYL